MADLIDKQAAIESCMNHYEVGNKEQNSVMAWCVDMLHDMPSADTVEVVRCKDCKHRWVNEHYGEKGYMKIKVMCLLDTDDPFELGRNAYDDNWFCADGERKDE